ncbi:hypothetical protein LUZ60_017490 [Juncus effusus]|nr:hypothetical protein LUZ60_017490 [Juncus effusus]
MKETEHNNGKPSTQTLNLERQLSSESSREYYQPKIQIPFEWESEPGKPKNPIQTTEIPPLCPSPAMQSARLAWTQKKQRRMSQDESKPAVLALEGCFVNPFKVIVCRFVRKWNVVWFFRAD